MHTLKRHLRIGLLIGACALPLAGPAPAAVVLESKSGDDAAGGVLDRGGLPVIPSGPLRLTCTQYGVKIADERLRNVAVSPLNAIGWLSFEQEGGHGRSILLPFGDGGTACLLSPDAAYLKRAAAAFRAAITENRPVSWGSTLARAMGRVAPTRTFTDPEGRTCRAFIHTLNVNGRADTESGTACERAGGAWRVMP